MAATRNPNLGETFYQPAKAFFDANKKIGITYDESYHVQGLIQEPIQVSPDAFIGNVLARRW